MNRQFLKSTMDVDKKTPAYKIICNHCRQSEKVAAPNNILPPEFIAKKFRQKGWIVSKKGNEDICPKCLLPAPTKTLPPAVLLAFTPPGEKPKSLPSLKDLATVMTPPTPPVLVTPVAKDEPAYPWRPATPAPAPVSTKPEFTGPPHALPGEIRYADVVKSGWVGQHNLNARMKTNELTPRRAGLRKTFFKREELVKLFGEPKVRASLRLPKPRPIVDALTAPVQTPNKEPAHMNHDPRLPPEMTKEDRRIIFAEIDTHYLDETTGYATDYNDKRIADGLKVPLAWVRIIREENFGPEKNPDSEYKSLKILVGNAEKSLKSINDVMARVNNRMSELKSMQDALVKQVGGINDTIVNINSSIANANVRIAHLTGKK